MKFASMLEEIREANLSYLLLAQNMIREDRAQAMQCLGIGEDVAVIIEGLSPAQVVKAAATSQLMCRVSTRDDSVLGLMADGARRRNLAGAHVSAMRAGGHARVA